MIVLDPYDLTIQSKCTGHYWYLHSAGYPSDGSCIIFHKHRYQHPYHQHGRARTLRQAIKSIKDHDNYTDYQDTIPFLFYYNAFLVLSNGMEAKVGTLGSKYEFFHEWKRLSEDDEGSVALETMLRGICKKENFLDLYENFILYDHSDGKTVKILARNHQYLGVNEAVKAYGERQLREGKLGVFWHTQGSGKSY